MIGLVRLETVKTLVSFRDIVGKSAIQPLSIYRIAAHDYTKKLMHVLVTYVNILPGEYLPWIFSITRIAFLIIGLVMER